MHHPTDRIAHTTTFVKPVMEFYLVKANLISFIIYLFIIAITAYAEAEVVAEELMALSTVDHMTVEREGDCANFDYILTWLSQPGDLNPVTVSEI